MARQLQLGIVGDSLLSGQGLKEENKIHRLVQNGIHLLQPDLEIHSRMLAHSGAILTAGPQGREASPWPHVEVPIPYPTVSQQLTTLISSPEKVDVLLLNGGVVDANLLLIMNPFVGASRLAPRIDRIFRMDMRVVLSRAARAFPDALIIVAPYYPIITEESDPSLLGPFLMAHGVLRDELGSAAARMAPPVLAGWVRRRVAANCAILAERSTAGFRAAAEAVNASVGRIQVVVADPPPVVKHAALTPDPWLFGINADMTTQDETAGERRRACRCQIRRGFNCVRCCRASAGHPNATGAARYADAILQAIRDHPMALLAGGPGA